LSSAVRPAERCNVVSELESLVVRDAVTPHAVRGDLKKCRLAVLSMDVEDWYHLDYLDKTRCDREYSLLDGLEVYAELLSSLGIAGTFFILGELARKLTVPLQTLAARGHEIASHGWNHVRPLTLSPAVFAEDLRHSKTEIEEVIGRAVEGYRAPCFSLDRARFDLVRAAGYKYDSSRILFKQHPLYGTLDLTGFTQWSRNIFQKEDFFEFQVSTLPLAGRDIPVSGGGYLRIFPWLLMRSWVKRYLTENELYVHYIHPFELSAQPAPILPQDTGWLTRFRFRFGQSRVPSRLFKLIELLKSEGFTFTTFAELRATLVQGQRNRAALTFL